MVHPLAEYPVRPITVDEALRMLDVGILQDGEPVELLLGAFVAKPVKTPEHVEVKGRVGEWLWELGPRRLRLQDPLVGADGISMPEPDLAIVEPGDPSAHPVAALLVVEISKPSYRLDTTVKPPIYASMGVPDYWVVDVARQRVVVYREPRATGYASQSIHEAPGTLAPLHVDVPPLDLAQLFR